LQYYVDLAKELEKMGAHVLCIKDMAGLCRPYAAHKLVKTLRQEIGLPVHFHTHDTSGVQAAAILQASDAGVDIVDTAIASMSGSTSQPNLNSLVAALEHQPRATGLDLQSLNEFSDYWEAVKKYYHPFDTAPRNGTAEVYLHEMPGGQYTNLKEQANSMGLGNRWPEIARTYAEVNQLFGDIVKVTPSSKVVGDMAMFCITRGIKPADVVNLEPGSTPFPESVFDMLEGNLGQPQGGFPKKLQKVILGDRKPRRGRPGSYLKPIDLNKTKKEISEKLDAEATEDDLYSYLMYPQVFEEFAKFTQKYSDVSVLPTPAYFYGLKPEEEISVDIEEGKKLFLKLLNVGPVNKDGTRVVSFELNGITRQIVVEDKSVQPETKKRDKADPNKPEEVGAPIPGMITSVSASVGQKVNKGDKLLTLEAMKMYTTINAPESGVVEEIFAEVSDSVESKDLLVRLKLSK